MKHKYKLLLSFLFFLSIPLKTMGEEVSIEIETEKSKIDIQNESFEASDGVILKYGDITLRADNMKKLENRNVILASGNVLLTQGTEKVLADEVEFDLDTKKAIIKSSKAYDSNLQLYFGGEETISEYPSKITINNAWFTPSPFEEPSYKIDADKLTIYPNRKLEARGISLNIKGKDYFKIPYYVTSLRPANRRATLFPYIGSDSDRGLFGILGFDYEKGPLLNGFLDVEYSVKKNLALKFGNDYKIGDYNTGSIDAKRLVLPLGNNKNEWDITLNHKVKYAPKKDINYLKFYELGYGIWDLNYKNITTNLMYAVDGTSLDDDYSAFIKKYDKIGTFDFKIDQELGKNGEFNLDYYWTRNKDALKELTAINDKIVDEDELDPRKTDIDLYKNIKYSNGNNDYAVSLQIEDFQDINPGYVGDVNSFRKLRNYSVDLKGPKIKLDYTDSDYDEYNKILNLKERDDADYNSLETSNRIVQTTAYNRNNTIGLTFGNYYPFRKTDFFGYEEKSFGEKVLNNTYVGFGTAKVNVEKKTYEYDYTTDNPNFKALYLSATTDDKSRIYKVFEDGDKIRRAKSIIDENYLSQVFRVGNEDIKLPIKDSYLSYEYDFERRDYTDIYVPIFDSDRRKIEDTSSITGYKIKTDSTGNTIKKSPQMNIHKFNSELFTTLYDNTALRGNSYDLKVTNSIPVLFQAVTGKNATDGVNDIIETPTNAYAIGDDFNIYLGNVRFNYNVSARRDKHFAENWLKNAETKNYFNLSIANKRFVSLNFTKNENYEYEGFKSEENYNREVQYGYKTDEGNSFLYKLGDYNYKNYSNDIADGWQKQMFKERTNEKNFSINYNEWGFEYANTKDTLKDIFDGVMNLKLETNRHTLGFVYDTKRMKEKDFESNHYFRMSYSFGNEKYRALNNTPTNYADDTYVNERDTSILSFMYRYENDASPKYAATATNNVENKEMVKQSNLQSFDIANNVKTSISSNSNVVDDGLTTEEQVAYQNYVEEERLKQNKFNLRDFNSQLQDLRKNKKYFQVSLDLGVDSEYLREKRMGSGTKAINDFIFKTEAGYLDKFYVKYTYDMERPDVLDRNISSRKSSYDFRQHELETKYMFAKDPDKPWWIGYTMQYTQNGAPNVDNPEIYESSSLAEKVNKITLQMVTLTHKFENLEWEIGVGRKWDKPDNKDLGFYPIVSLKFGIVNFPEKNLQYNYTGGASEFGAGF